jgi:hypothetical protein
MGWGILRVPVHDATEGPVLVMKMLTILFVFLLSVAMPADAHDLGVASGLMTVVPPDELAGRLDVGRVPLTDWEASCATGIRLARKGKHVAGMVRVYTEDGQRVALDGLLPRSTQLEPRHLGEAAYAHMNTWSVIPGDVTVSLPRVPLIIEAFHGTDSPLARTRIDLGKYEKTMVALKVPSLLEGRDTFWRTGNTHLHVQRMTVEEAERYSCEIAAADGYDVVFFSHLERAEADEHYTSNWFTPEDLARFSERSGVLFGFGEEYRHNFVKTSEGYGHVMFLDLEELVLPASFGYSITKQGNDDGTLRDGIQLARERKGTVLWCHGARGLEDIPNWLAGLIDVQMMFDQGSLGSYEHALYRYLDIGLRVPVSTGTDWFFRDMAMAYVQTGEPLTTEGWLNALRLGRSFITNGPLLDLWVNGQGLGETVEVSAGDVLTFEASAVGRRDFKWVELLRNGVVIGGAPAERVDDRYVAKLRAEFPVHTPSWFALRVKPFAGDYDEPESVDVGFNEYGKPLYAHTSPIYLSVDGEKVFSAKACADLLEETRGDRARIAEEGEYTNDAERERVLAVYDEAIAGLETRLPNAE